MRSRRFHGLKKIKLRQSWNKYNLYNLARAEPPNTTSRTFFQQKWTAKSFSRAYHGETIREKHWTRMFRRSIRSVVPMDHEYLAGNDGSEQAAGRGLGADVPPGKKPKPYPKTPYMNMVYAPTERRLDTAIFRALFASSTRQARQFVVHGNVKVNGKKMIYPGYQLNPGDMFQVDPERVLWATGAPKNRFERREGRQYRAKISKTEGEVSQIHSKTKPEQVDPTPSQDGTAGDTTPQESLKALLLQAKSLLINPTEALTAKRKQDLRAFQRTVKRTLSKPNTLPSASLESQLQEITSRMAPASSSADTPRTPASADVPAMSTPSLQAEAAALSPDQLRNLRKALIEARENPVDPSKPYATPWRPRDYMSAFAFIPRYLEVHQKVCSAVYLRHPVARPGLAEVPTPFGIETNSLAHTWYLRRR